ncbi:gamma-glutamyl hydrolase [Haematococcus lacustris]|uniref:Gamma-glutamyl hydrolase n=1 Tax=Haematococcus lacustris TaxID=44745 RepID=A0A699YVV0_HAELA|nr:gamma-glutamyl hydrolase [Haematococcus lacustris]
MPKKLHTQVLPAVAAVWLQTTEEENYDGPDITYYFDKPDHPPSGPDDSLHNGKSKGQLQQVSQHPNGFFLG